MISPGVILIAMGGGFIGLGAAKVSLATGLLGVLLILLGCAIVGV